MTQKINDPLIVIKMELYIVKGLGFYRVNIKESNIDIPLYSISTYTIGDYKHLESANFVVNKIVDSMSKDLFRIESREEIGGLQKVVYIFNSINMMGSV